MMKLVLPRLLRGLACGLVIVAMAVCPSLAHTPVDEETAAAASEMPLFIWDKDIPGSTVVLEDPKIITIDDFLTDKEIETILSLSPKEQFEQSTGGLERSVSTYRTSSTFWLNSELITDADKQQIMFGLEHKIAEIVGLPANNQEHLQVLHYNPGQYYKVHSDYIPEHKDLPCGPRVATLFLYLSDVEEGGGTRFPTLNVTVQPKRGRAALWFSVNPDLAPDYRTEHEALPVIKGSKWAANKWIHAYDFVTNWKRGLTG
eukprot:m.245103 g.245103  ORF g.245103 m.245103 type:complete len:259 (-) comp19048_c2_seq1:149-925(-)